MVIKVVSGSSVPIIAGKYCYLNKPTTVKNAEEEVKHYVEDGRKILIKDNDKWVNAKEYFDMRKTYVSASIKVEKDDIPYQDFFNGHWTKQVKRVKEYSDDPYTIDKILDYAIENNVSNGVVKRITNYLEDIKE